MRALALALAFSLPFTVLTACPGSSGDTDDTDTDSDTDITVGTDADSDSDSDSDSDADSDTDTDTADKSFACEELTCAGDEICVIGMGGAAPPPGEDGIHPSCQPAPEACASEPTCPCALDADICLEGAGDCDDSGDGVVCHIYYP